MNGEIVIFSNKHNKFVYVKYINEDCGLLHFFPPIINEDHLTRQDIQMIINQIKIRG